MQSLIQFELDIEIYDLNTNGLLATVIHNAFKFSNGCGAKGGIKFPSTMWFLNIESACSLHDIHWELAKDYSDLLSANEIFDNNLKKIIDKDSNFIMKRLRRLRAAKYVNEVELLYENLINNAMKNIK